MKLSTKSRYGLRAIVDLAIHFTGEQVPLIQIANRQQLSINYLEQIFSLLKKAHLVKSVKGSQGGYLLAKLPGEITVGEVIRAIEGNIEIIDEVAPIKDKSLLYDNMQLCLKRQVWDPMTEAICKVMDTITLEDLIKEYKQHLHNDANMYYI